MGNEVKIEDIPDGMKFEDYPDYTIFVWSEREEDDEWAQEAREQNKK